MPNVLKAERAAVSSALGLIESKKRKKLLLATLSQALLSFLDIVSVAIIGVVTSIALAGINSRQSTDASSRVIKLLNLDGISFQMQVATLGIIAAIFMICKTLFSAIMMRKVLFFLAGTASASSTQLIRRLVSSPWKFVKQCDSQQTLYALTTGVYALIIGVLGSALQIITEVFLITIMLITLLTLNPVVTAGASLFFASIMFSQHRKLKRVSTDVSFRHSNSTVLVNTRILNIFRFYRELYVRNSIRDSVQSVESKIGETMRLNAELKFLPNIARYSMEIALVLGALILASIQFTLEDAVTAITTLSVFLAASSRIAPSLIRLQNGFVNFNSAVGGANFALELIAKIEEFEVGSHNSKLQSSVPLAAVKESSNVEIEFRKVSFKFSDLDPSPTLNDLNFEIERGTFVALIGPSGSGKTTLIDLMLGLYLPTAGEVFLRGESPKETISKNPTLISYVPQETRLINGSISDNLKLGIGNRELDEIRAVEILRKLNLENLFWQKGTELEFQISENGANLSGGQKQRLNLARALVCEPAILILDEATSALDFETEQAVFAILKSLKGKVTIISIAHRMTTLLHADRIVFLKDGNVVISENFQELRTKVPQIEEEIALIQGEFFGVD